MSQNLSSVAVVIGALRVKSLQEQRLEHDQIFIYLNIRHINGKYINFIG